MNFLSSRRDYRVFWLGLAAFAWSMLFVWQGLDFTDMGMWLTGYQQFYTHPDTIFAACWLSSFIGHWLGLGLGGGVLGYKAGYVLIVTASVMIAYWVLAFQFGQDRLLAAMVLLTVAFTRVFGGNWVDYNNLTALFYLTGAALLFFGLAGNRNQLIVFAGAVLGANVFVRLPNVLGIALVAAIWFHAWLNRWTLRGVLKASTCYLVGFALGMASIWCLIVLHGHEGIYVQGIREVFGLAMDAGSSHAGSGMLRHFINDHLRAFSVALPLVVFGGWMANWVSKQRIVLVAAAVSTAALVLGLDLYRRGLWPWIIPGLCYVVLAAIIFRESKNDRKLALLALVAAMLLLLVPLGSNNGIANSVFGVWIALPLTLTWLWRTTNFAMGQFSMGARGIRAFTVTIVLALLFQSLASAWRFTYLDSQDRFAMTHSIAHPLLAGTYTTEDRSRVVTELLEAMSHFARPGDEVLAYNGIPTIFFLTETHPWLGVSWPDFAGTEVITTLIQKKEQSGAGLPCVVRATGSTYADSWPLGAKPLATWWRQDETRRAFAEFEQKHGYVVAWSNDFFEILTASK